MASGPEDGTYRARVESASLRLLETYAVLELPNPIDAFDHPTSLKTAIVHGAFLQKGPRGSHIRRV